MGENSTHVYFLRNIWAISFSYLCVSICVDCSFRLLSPFSASRTKKVSLVLVFFTSAQAELHISRFSVLQLGTVGTTTTSLQNHRQDEIPAEHLHNELISCAVNYFCKPRSNNQLDVLGLDTAWSADAGRPLTATLFSHHHHNPPDQELLSQKTFPDISLQICPCSTDPVIHPVPYSKQPNHHAFKSRTPPTTNRNNPIQNRPRPLFNNPNLDRRSPKLPHSTRLPTQTPPAAKRPPSHSKARLQNSRFLSFLRQ